MALFASVGMLAVAAPARASTTITSDDVTLTVGADGRLQAAETVTFEGSSTVRRSFVTRVHIDGRHDRIYPISNVRAGAGTSVSTHLDNDNTIVDLDSPGHTATFTYTVDGAILRVGGSQELDWTAIGDWTAPVAQAAVTVQATSNIQNLSCFTGEPGSDADSTAGDDTGSDIGCARFTTDPTGQIADFAQPNLFPGERLTVVVNYPAGAIAGRAILQPRHTVATAFTVNAVTGGSLIGLLLLLAGGVALLYAARGRDARAIVAEAEQPSGIESAPDFSPPDGVRPGQIGTLIDEQADVVDVTATIVDLAVRGYLMVEELPRETNGGFDWRLRRLDRSTHDLLPYERLLYDALFTGRDSVKLSELGGTFAGHLAAVRGALYDDVVTQGWFARRPDSERTRWTTMGVGLTGIGIIGTVVLALYTNLALIGLAVIAGGCALTFGGRFMPAKTTQGATVLASTLGFRRQLTRGEDASDSATPQRLALFSRYLPYAVVFDVVPDWAKIVADAGSDPLYWYEGSAEWDLSTFADSMRTFTLTASGAISATRQFRAAP